MLKSSRELLKPFTRSEQMKTLVSVVILAGAFLSVGAFANQAVQTHKTNVTVVYKNQAWPVKSQIVTHTCSITLCIDI